MSEELCKCGHERSLHYGKGGSCEKSQPLPYDYPLCDCPRFESKEVPPVFDLGKIKADIHEGLRHHAGFVVHRDADYAKRYRIERFWQLLTAVEQGYQASPIESYWKHEDKVRHVRELLEEALKVEGEL